MCGRFTLTITVEAIQERFEVAGELPAIEPRYNIAPGQPVPVVLTGGTRSLQAMRWGLAPPWVRERPGGRSLINLRAETLRDKAGFRRLLAGSRCLVPADGFFEWARDAAGRRGSPYRLALRNGAPFAFAGLWEIETTADGREAPAFTIITTEPNALVRQVHDRMPVILPRAAEESWLSAGTDATGELLALLKPFPATEMTSYAVSALVNSPKNDSPACIQPADLPARQPELWPKPEAPDGKDAH